MKLRLHIVEGVRVYTLTVGTTHHLVAKCGEEGHVGFGRHVSFKRPHVCT